MKVTRSQVKRQGHVAIVVLLASATLPAFLLQGRVHPAFSATIDVNGDTSETLPVWNNDRRLQALGRALWDAGDEMLTAGSFLGDTGWSNRGENPAVLGATGIAIRNAADAVLEGEEDWYTVTGELEQAAASGDYYFSEAHFEDLLVLFPTEDEGVGPAGWPKARAALLGLADEIEEVADRVRSDEISSRALDNAAKTLSEVANVFVHGNEPPQGLDDSPEGRVEAALREAGEGRQAALRRLAVQYHPDQNPGREEQVLPIFLHVQKLREQEGDTN